MGRNDSHVDAEFYIQLEPNYSRWETRTNGEPAVQTARAVRMTAKRPTKPIGGSVMVKLTVRIPKSAFYALEPEAVIEVPEGLVEGTPIKVSAEDPNREESWDESTNNWQPGDPLYDRA